jgi:putative transposase
MMTADEKHAVALVRYSAISGLVAGTADPGTSQNDFYREAASRTYSMPNGTPLKVTPATIKRWYSQYRRFGFDGLMPVSRSDAGKSRTLDDASQEYIRYMKEHYPRMPAAAIWRQMISEGVVSEHDVSESTVNRFINQFMKEAKLTNNKDMRRYERPHINEVWCGDSSVGPRLLTPSGKKKVYIIALIDDASRFIVGIDVFFKDNFVGVMSVMRSAVSKYGKPKIFNFDNGSPYRNKQMELLTARIGSSINYCEPYTPTSKSKIERWFRTLKDHWMAQLDMRDVPDLDALRKSLQDYVDVYNRTIHSSLSGSSPSDRFFSEPEQIRRLTENDIQKAFLLEIERTVSADSVIVIDQTEYEVSSRFARRHVRLRYSPDLSEIFIVEDNGELTPIRLLDKHANASAKRSKVQLSRCADNPAEPSDPSGTLTSEQSSISQPSPQL